MKPLAFLLVALALVLAGCGAKAETPVANTTANAPTSEQSHAPGAPGMPPARPR